MNWYEVVHIVSVIWAMLYCAICYVLEFRRNRVLDEALLDFYSTGHGPASHR